MRLISSLVIFLAVSFGMAWVWTTYPNIKNLTQDVLNTGSFQTLEVRYSADNIMDMQRHNLLKDAQHLYLEPQLKFYPYLLMEVKYNRSYQKTGEGVILWSLVDGEMVINTSNWTKTHGFNDCINAGADRDEFKVINALASSNNALDRAGLLKALNLEGDALDYLLDNCRRKNLIVQSGNIYRLHLQNPKLQVVPETTLEQWLVTKPSKYASRVSKRFRSYQVENIARAAFGNDFAIRKSMEIFLPVYSIIVQNPDGSQMTTYWNALNGKRIHQHYHIE